jgi:hypothetical protein
MRPVPGERLAAVPAAALHALSARTVVIINHTRYWRIVLPIAALV